MISTSNGFKSLTWLSPLLDRLERYLWNDVITVDSTTPAFYVFKPFPSSIKSAQHQDWASLQIRTLSPFTNGDVYHYLSKEGVSIWATPNHFDGIPETAMQKSLEDGCCKVRGKSFVYNQEWEKGVMLSCRAEPESAGDQHLKEIELKEGWARVRPLEQWLKTPFAWGSALLFIFFSAMFFQLGGIASVQIQKQNLNESSQALELKVGDKLEMLGKFQQEQQIIRTVSQWQNELGQLPQALALVVDVVIQHEPWEASLLEWQNKTLRVELVLSTSEISTLVSELEKTKQFSNVAIRPHARENTWNLEVTAL